jgi:hypothetical protein
MTRSSVALAGLKPRDHITNVKRVRSFCRFTRPFGALQFPDPDGTVLDTNIRGARTGRQTADPDRNVGRSHRFAVRSHVS